MAQGHTASETGPSRTWVCNSQSASGAECGSDSGDGSYKDSPFPYQSPSASHTYKDDPERLLMPGFPAAGSQELDTRHVSTGSWLEN